MADLALVTTGVLRPVFAETAEIRDMKEAETLAVGDVVYQTTAGKAGKADANDAGKEQARGIVVSKQGSTVSVMKRGYLSGFDLSGMNYDAQAFLSNSAGKLADAAGAMSVPCGRVSALTNDSLTKVLYVDFNWITQWA
jgi:hypothetical protein